MPGEALGLLETHGLVAAVVAADAMVKAAAVTLVRQQRTVPALVTHVVVGETAAVRAAVEAGAAAAARVGKVAGSLVIPRPADGVWELLAGGPASARVSADPAPPSVTPTPPDPAPAPTEADGDDAAGSADNTSGDDTSGDDTSGADYADRTVRELRQIARDRDDDRLRGRAIAQATKDELVAFLQESDR